MRYKIPPCALLCFPPLLRHRHAHSYRAVRAVRTASRPLVHEPAVELLNLANVVFDTGAERGKSEMVRALLLAEAAADGADTRGVYAS
jgi:hypothetical protein